MSIVGLGKEWTPKIVTNLPMLSSYFLEDINQHFYPYLLTLEQKDEYLVR